MCIFNRLFFEPNYIFGVKVDFVVPWAFLSRYTICYTISYMLQDIFYIYAICYKIYGIQYTIWFYISKFFRDVLKL